LSALVQPALVLLGLLVLVLAVANLAATFTFSRQVRELARRLDAVTRGSEGRSLEGVLDSHLQRVYNVARDVETIQARAKAQDVRGRKAVQRVGLVRFNAFEDTASNQSFALALLDGDEDGLVLSSIHSRQATRVYAKAINAGRPDGPMSGEETEALRIARTNGAAVTD
jgi:uncharacterized protein DUF4446